MKLPYEQMKFYYVTNYYDYPLSGTCIYNNRIALFEAIDETDYETMRDTCPYCSDQTTDADKCHCQNAPDLFYHITTLPLLKRIYYRMAPELIWLFWYIRRYKWIGISYWKHWYWGKYK